MSNKDRATYVSTAMSMASGVQSVDVTSQPGTAPADYVEIISSMQTILT
jgi:hypothetical protein